MAGVVAHRVLENVALLQRPHWTLSITLPAQLITEQGLRIFKELPDVHSRIYGHVGDKRTKSP